LWTQRLLAFGVGNAPLNRHKRDEGRRRSVGLGTTEPAAELRETTCVECGATTIDPHGWAAFRVDLEPGDEPELAFYCPACCEREFGGT
jgi:hypothetical protein